ncbi:assimilatory nitrate reductase catalytic subunit [Alteromonadaceae bacterium Bs31]|nr:assimilatory nitrate reductase catalytic subunit [Alteromonadaceae bacterium Bs31]
MNKLNTILASDNSSQNTTCCYCGVGCGVTAEIADGQIVKVTGDKQHPANKGRLCVKGSALHQTQQTEDRLLTPLLHGEAASWDESLNYAAEKFKKIIHQHGPDAVAFYLSGQILTEDYYVANKLMKGFVGTANVDTNSRLCMASATVAHKRAFGADTVPGCYEDLEICDLLVLVGSNTAYAHPVIYQRIAAAKKARPDMKVVVIDPRRTSTCDIADIHLPLRPGADAFLFNGLLNHLSNQGAINKPFVAEHCQGFNEALAAANAQCPSLAQTATLCDLPIQELEQFYQWFSHTEKTVTVFSQGINQSSSGVDKGNAIINCHLATGRIGKAGASPFSITGQPNAMGGREVGGLANQLAAHMGFDNPEHINRVERFWQAENMARKEGAKAVDMFQQIYDGKIKAVWIMATNPVVTMPNANFVREALQRCELVMVSECIANTDTAKQAHVVFPASTWSEKHGTVTNSERCISLQKGLLPPPGESRHDWQIICDFAKRLGFEKAFSYEHPAEIFREHAQLSAFENDGSRDFDISAYSDISIEDYNTFQPIQWPVTASKAEGTRRMFVDGKFFTPSGRAQLIAITAQFPRKPPRDGQLIMNTGRIRDQWHTMSRTGNAAKLMGHAEEPYIDIHPQDANKLGLKQHDIAKLENLGAHFFGRIQFNQGQRRGEIFVPMHWNERFASSSRADALVNSVTDPICGQPEFKHSPVKISAYPVAWSGTLHSLVEIEPSSEYWCKIPLDKGFKYRIADAEKKQHWHLWLQKSYPHISDWIEMGDSEKAFFCAAGFVDGALEVVLRLTRVQAAPGDSRWLDEQLGKLCDIGERFAVLGGNAGANMPDQGKIICSCFQVGENEIKDAINQGCSTVEALGKEIKCGSNCGSCIPELGDLLRSHHAPAKEA